MPWWAVLSSASAPVLLIGGWEVAARRQPAGFDSTVDTISALAALDATDRWLMTAALVGVGIAHVVTALGLSRAAPAGRIVLGLGGVATMLVAAFPLAPDASTTAHMTVATAAFVALAVWPALAWRRGPGPAALRPAVSSAAALVLLGLIGWFAVTLTTGDHVGLAERVAAGAQSLWPLATVLSSRGSGR
ncbi:membrane protein [Actinoplanes sp. NBRC 101535]|nr:membrane protein [Actinoplanes sp. NBRC 101535]